MALVHDGRASNGHDAARWTFFTNHFFVLACVAGDPDLRVRDIAELVGITERATQAILSDLAAERYLERARIGRRNRYTVCRDAPLRHSLMQTTTIGEVLEVFLSRLSSAVV